MLTAFNATLKVRRNLLLQLLQRPVLAPNRELQCKLQPSGDGRQPVALGSKQRRRPQQARRQSINPLTLPVQPAPHHFTEPGVHTCQCVKPGLPRRCHQFGRRRWSRGTDIGHEIGDREIGLVSDAAYQWHRASSNGARQGFVIEGP